MAWLFTACILCCCFRASAAGNAEVSIKGEAPAPGASNWTVTCELDSDQAVTNGKIRITYDAAQLKLKDSQAGSLLNGAMTTINDPLTGNKEEGEVVLVFAASSEMGRQGTLLTLTFELNGAVAQGDTVAVAVKTEELMMDTDVITARDLSLSAAVGGTATNVDNTTSQTESESQKGSESQEPEENDPGTSSGDGSAGDGSGDGNASGNENSNGSGNAVSTKTGDSTNILFPAIAAVAALLVAGACFSWKRKKVQK